MEGYFGCCYFAVSG